MARQRRKQPAPPTERAKALLKAYAQTCNLVQACKDSKVSRTTHYRWLRNHPQSYGIVYERARVAAGDFLESVAVERATVGWEEDVFYQGQKCGSVTRYSDGLLMQLLRGLKPDVYGVKAETAAAPIAPMQAKIEIVFVRPGDVPRIEQGPVIEGRNP